MVRRVGQMEWDDGDGWNGRWWVVVVAGSGGVDGLVVED